MLWRIILGYPLGNPHFVQPSAMVNIIGSEHYTGTPKYIGLEEVLAIENTFVHVYGKQQTKPGRKMGHITVLGTEQRDLIYKANKIKQSVAVIS
jgi:5-(carboxyamino)imidazole ribonucleotide synthase